MGQWIFVKTCRLNAEGCSGLLGRGISQKSGKKIRDVDFWFSIYSGQGKDKS